MPCDEKAVMHWQRSARWRVTVGVLTVLILLPSSATPAVDNPAASLAVDSEGWSDYRPGETWTEDELREEMRALAWTKGDYRIVPYGVLWGSAIYTTSRLAPGEFIVYVFSETDEGESDFVLNVQRTRLGLNIEGPDIVAFHGASSAAQVEIDFHNARGSVDGSAVRGPANQPGVQLRHAYAEIRDDDFRLLAGQTWDVVSPLLPGTLTYAVAWGGGNLGYRRPQIRYERYLRFHETSQITLQAAIAQDIGLDLIGQSESTNQPEVQMRAAWTLGERGGERLPLTFGVSSHLGRQGYDFAETATLPAVDDARLRTWSLNADLQFALTDNLGFQGEFFTGENLSSHRGGVMQGINPLTRRPIQASGGWAELWYDWTPRLQSRAGFGIDDPRDSHIAPGGRTQNRFVFGNLRYLLAPQFAVGMEVSHWKTHYQDKLPGDAVVLEFTGSYGF